MTSEQTMTIEQLEEYRKEHHYIPPEDLLAAYRGMPVEKINPIFVGRMDLRKLPNLVLDDNMRLSGIYYGANYEQLGYIEIRNDEMGEYLIKPKRDRNGNPIIPKGWEDSRWYEEWEDECVEDLRKELEENGFIVD